MYGLDSKVVNDLTALRSVGATRNLVASNISTELLWKSKMKWLVMASKVS